MKTFKYIIAGAAVLLAVGLSSCEDYLTTNPSTSVADTEVFKTTAGAQAALNGCYFQMRAYSSGGTGRDDDYGIPTVMAISDVCGEDMIVWGGWYPYTYNYWGETRADIFRAEQMWTFHYRLINNLNAIITNIDQCIGEDQEKQYIKGQALAMRGWAYFDLARLFQQTYAIAKDMPGVPIYTEPTTEATEGKPRGTLQQTYDQVLADLTQAETLLEGYDRSNRTNNMDQSVTQAILAQVYLTMTNWSKAEEYCKKVMDQYPLTTNEEYLAGFNDDEMPSCIWGMKQTEEQNMGDYSQFAFWANGTRKCYTFQCWFLATDFVNMFDKEDIRASQFEFWWDQIYASHKFRDNEECLGSYIFLRTEDMLLSAAEACAHQGKEAEAKELLWKLQDMRQTKRSETSGADLIEDILVERRKELYGEGYALFDIIRNQKPLLRSGNHVNYGGNIQLPARSWRFIFQIPSTEMKNNKALVDDIWPAGDQNPFNGSLEL